MGGRGCGCGRRAFLTSLLAAGTQPLGAQPAEPGRGAIDVHHHVFAPAFLKATETTVVGASRQRMVEWSPERSIAEMDASGVAAAVLSVTNPGIWLGGERAAPMLARECNEYSAQLVKQHPGRFGFFAALPLPDTDASLREIAYSLDTLRADGIGLMTSYGDKWLGDPAFAAAFDELHRRRAVVYVHPTTANCCRQLMPGIPDPLIEFPHDTTRAVVSLLYSGTFARCRGIRFIFSHAGGTIPMLSGRLTETGALFGIDKKLPEGVESELKRLHYDTANSAHTAAFAALKTIAPMSQIVFGTDYPFIPMQSTVGGLATLGLGAADLQSIRRDNALTLFPRLKTAST